MPRSRYVTPGNRWRNVDFTRVARDSKCQRESADFDPTRDRQNILDKLGMGDRVELTCYAIRRGLIQL
jgi:hypothetical protein